MFQPHLYILYFKTYVCSCVLISACFLTVEFWEFKTLLSFCVHLLSVLFRTSGPEGPRATEAYSQTLKPNRVCPVEFGGNWDSERSYYCMNRNINPSHYKVTIFFSFIIVLFWYSVLYSKLFNKGNILIPQESKIFCG